MNKDQKEAYDAVEKINTELYNKYSKNYDLDKMPMLSFTICSPYLFIGLTIPSSDVCTFPEFEIYNSENNDRTYYEIEDKYETFYKFIKRKFREIKEELNTVKL